jgi:hypothetical protein
VLFQILEETSLRVLLITVHFHDRLALPYCFELKPQLFYQLVLCFQLLLHREYFRVNNLALCQALTLYIGWFDILGKSFGQGPNVCL